MAGKRIDAATLAEIKQHYCANKLTVAEIGLRYGRSPSGISQLARRKGWPPRLVHHGESPAKRLALLRQARDGMLLRYYGTMSRHFEQMEADLARGGLSPDEVERRAKSMRSMHGAVENVEKVSAAGAHADQDPQPSLPAPDDTAEAERIRREIMERFERIQRRWDAEGAAD